MKTKYLRKLSVAIAVVLSMVGFASSAYAGNIALTGHDDDFHQSLQAQAQVLGMLTFVDGGILNTLLPVLTFDHGNELTSLLSTMGISYFNVDPNAGIPSPSLFDITKYNAIMVASDQSCGGCDNDSTSSTNLASASSSFASYFNAGGGIVGLAGASNSNYYNFLPLSASNPGIVFDSNAFTQTAAGLSNGISAVNGDFPHNFFAFPGSGTDLAFQAMEVYSGPSSLGDLTNQPFTIAASGSVACTGLSCVITPVPEPATIALIGLGLAGFAASRKHKTI